MEIERAGIIFDVQYRGGSPSTRYVQGDPEEIIIRDWSVYDWDELAAHYGIRACGKVYCDVQDIADQIMERDYDKMLNDAIDSLRDKSNYDPPDLDD